jgi:hypothetical protein
MNVPSTIKIAGVTYTIEAVSQLRAEENCSGRVLFNKAIIQLDDSLCAEIASATLLHEVIEIINCENELKMSHRMIQSMATQIYGVIKDNVEMFTE